jgi:molecular chaperone GrpE
MEAKKDKPIYPKVVAGVFIFNDKNELFLAKSPRWHDKYICPGGKVELNEKIEDTVKREVKEETNMKITDVEFIKVIDGLGVDKSYTKEDNHLIFLDHIAKTKGDIKIKLNEELTEYKWLPLEDWLKKKELKFGPFIYESLKRIKEFKEMEDFKNMYLRVVADYENLKKDTEKQKQEWIRFANNNLISEILPVLDNFKVAVDHIPEEEKDSSWVVGITYIQNQLKKALEDNGVEEIKTFGEKFDPELHEAIDQETSKEELKKYKEGYIVKELRPGYKLHGKVITPAKVIVKK